MNEFKVNAKPTKDFFIGMLTKDISLDRAILDLIDNSVDAAFENKILAPEVKLTVSDDSFIIEDNCGGFDLEVAKNYAFRFGRPTERSNTPHSVGQFGVGMKRTLFKLGRVFEVISNRANVCFKVRVDVGEWQHEDDWEFGFEIMDKAPIDSGTTKITVWGLYEAVADQLKLDNYLNNLSRECSLAHFKAMNAGMELLINGKKAENYEIKIYSSGTIEPVKLQVKEKGVIITITAGISDRSLSEAGWYIVCNGRLVQEAEQSKVSGWTVDGIPKYHADYAFFRGIVEFDANDSGLLPWTTTKTGIDKDSLIYKAALFHMKKTMREIITFLKERTREAKDDKDKLLNTTPLQSAIKSAKLVNFSKAEEAATFTRPKVADRVETPRRVIVQYDVDIDDLNKVKTALGVATAKEVGIETFNYYKSFECEE
jgi:hypothetical protein